MENKLLVSILIASVVLLIFGISSMGYMVNSATQEDIKVLNDKLDSIVIPSVDDIANKTAALIKLPVQNDNKLNDLWKHFASSEINELEDEAEDVATEELEDDNFEELEEFFELMVPSLEKIKDVDINDVEVEYLELGLEDDEDKSAMVYFKIKVKYTLESGPVEQYKTYVYASAFVEFDEGDFSDEDVEIKFSLEELSQFE